MIRCSVVALLGITLLTLPNALAIGQTVLDVAHWGALPDDDRDDTAALRQALAEARRTPGPVEVVLATGVYRISRLNESDAAGLPLHGLRSVTLRGEGPATRLLIDTFAFPAIELRECRDVTVRGLSIDYATPPFTQGPITSVAAREGWFEFSPLPSAATPDWPFLRAQAGFGMVMDQDPRRPKDGNNALFVARWEASADGTWRVFPRADCLDQIERFQPGDGYVHLARQGFAVVPVLGSADCLLEDIHIHAGSALAFCFMGNEGKITLRSSRVAIEDGSDRWISTNGDAVHCQNNRVGPIIEDCYFAGMADDAINIYATPAPLVDMTEDGGLTLLDAGHVRVGDTLQLFSPLSGDVHGEVRVIDIEPLDDTRFRVAVDRPLTGLHVEADRKRSTCAFNLSASGSGFVIRRNTFGPHRGRCLVLRTTHEGVVEHNRFGNPSATYAIYVANEPQWPEGPFPMGQLSIRHNHFVAASVSDIAVFGFRLGDFSPHTLGPYAIDSNTFEGPHGTAIHLGRVESASVNDNVFAEGLLPLAADDWRTVVTDLPNP